jgi:hypothetical protein
MKTIGAAFRQQAMLNCTLAGLAIERFRLQKGRWPGDLGEVVQAKLLATVPLDPFDGNPLRYRKAKDGVVVFSIGRNKDHKGDRLDAIPDQLGEHWSYRTEFRLWDVDQRGKAAAKRKD